MWDFGVTVKEAVKGHVGSVGEETCNEAREGTGRGKVAVFLPGLLVNGRELSLWTCFGSGLAFSSGDGQMLGGEMVVLYLLLGCLTEEDCAFF